MSLKPIFKRKQCWCSSNVRWQTVRASLHFHSYRTYALMDKRTQAQMHIVIDRRTRTFRLLNASGATREFDCRNCGGDIDESSCSDATELYRDAAHGTLFTPVMNWNASIKHCSQTGGHYRALHGTAPQYLSDRLQYVDDLPTRRRGRLRSSTSSLLDVRPSRRVTVGDRSFAAAGPRL